MENNLKECFVACKATQSQLETICYQEQVGCRDLGIVCGSVNYDVEYLCDYKRIYIAGRRKTDSPGLLKEKELYLVKWRGYPRCMNTWEPRRNLKCPELLRLFWEDVSAELRRRNRKEVPRRLEPELSSYVVQRARQRQRLLHWEEQLNILGGHRKRVLVRNDVDLEEPPEDFIYIKDYKVADSISVTQVAVGCECTDCLEAPSGGCCPGFSGHGLAYDENGLVKIKPGQPIYECNKYCSCGPDCSNRVVQRGIQHTLSIFRTDNGRGWGVRTTERIKKNAFVVEYLGEIITTEEAERRGQVYDRQGQTYLFDLDYVEDVYTVDAAHYGNVSHFINHSCDPNLQVYNVFIDNLDERLPRLAFFSTRTIKRGEELTFDYNMEIEPIDVESTKMDSNFSKTGLSGSPKKKLRVECKCGVASCRKYLF